MTAPYRPHQPQQLPPPYPLGQAPVYPDQPHYPPPQPLPKRAVTKTRKQTSHGLYLFLTIITCGLWGLFVWFPLTLWHKFGPRRREVTKYR